MALGQPGEKTGAGSVLELRYLADVGISEDGTTILDAIVCPRDITVKAVKVIVNGSDHAASADIDVKAGSTSILSSVVEIVADATAYSGALDATQVKIDEDTIISLRAVTDGSGHASAITVQIMYENRDVT